MQKTNYNQPISQSGSSDRNKIRRLDSPSVWKWSEQPKSSLAEGINVDVARLKVIERTHHHIS